MQTEEALVQSNHQKMVAALAKPGAVILTTLTPEKVDLVHAVMGMVSEACEILDAVKAHAIYGKPLNRENILEELGDLEFYTEQLRRNQGFTRLQALEHNMAKLAKRYKNFQYSDQAAVVREDKKETGETDNRVL